MKEETGTMKSYAIPAILGVMIMAAPTVFAFLAGALEGTFLGGLTQFKQAFFDIFFGPSLAVGALLVLWGLVRMVREASFSPLARNS